MGKNNRTVCEKKPIFQTLKIHRVAKYFYQIRGGFDKIVFKISKNINRGIFCS